MALFNKESLEQLRSKVDVVEVLSSYIDLKRAGASYKACCPFHGEKTPSFVVQRGQSHYHCFGCGAHGDAIAFLMQHLKLSFSEAVESLATRFHVSLEKTSGEEKKGPAKSALKEVLDVACTVYHEMLLHTNEGHEALNYLYQRGIDLNFIRSFHLGYSCKNSQTLKKALASFTPELLIQAGLYMKEGERRDLFCERIVFPIKDSTESVIGFSGRKFKESTFGGKYINTPETPLFKKSQVLFGLNYCRRRIAKERCALIVEGQIDTLRLIEVGFNFTVSGQGTAFGLGHVAQLVALGVTKVYLAFDADMAGVKASIKVGDLFQKQGIEVYIVSLSPGQDPDTLVLQQGSQAMMRAIASSVDYLTFLVDQLSLNYDINSPAGKTQLIQTISAQIKAWDHPLMVYETLRKLAQILQVPQEMVGGVVPPKAHFFLQRGAIAGHTIINPDQILETDLLRWLVLVGQETPQLISLVQKNIIPSFFRSDICRKIFEIYLQTGASSRPPDFLSLAIEVDDEKSSEVISSILDKKVNKERAVEHCMQTVQKMLDREWMGKREEIKQKIQSGQFNEEEVLSLAKQFDDLKKNPPQVQSV